MTYVVSLENFTPGQRYDGTPWTQARIEEALSPSGLWAALQTVALTPLDVDPTQPQPRSVTTSLATLAHGFYRLVFIDAAGGEQATAPVQRLPPGLTVEDLRSYLRSGDVEPGVPVVGSRETDDAFLMTLLSSAILRAQSHAGREFLPTPGVGDPAVTRMAHPRGSTYVAVPDVRAIESITADGTLLTADQYELVGRRDQPAQGLRLLGAGAQTVQITGHFGFAAPPDDVRLAILTMAARGFHDAQARLGDRVVDPDGSVTSYFRQLPVEAKGVLDSYRLTAVRLV